MACLPKTTTLSGLISSGTNTATIAIRRQLVIQDVTTLHGSQFRDAALIVASPPCQAYSYRAMPWKRAKALPPPDNTLFEACFRIQREASEAAGRHIPLIVENVRGAQKWVGRARWNYGSFYLWGDVPALMPITFRATKVPGFRFDGYGGSLSRPHPSSIVQSRCRAVVPRAGSAKMPRLCGVIAAIVLSAKWPQP